MLGRRDKALPLLNRALGLTSADNKLLFRAAEIYEQLGYRQQALSFIAKALEHGYSKVRVERSPTFHELRADSGFQRLLQSQQQNLKR